jgi:hypothetical protein
MPDRIVEEVHAIRRQLCEECDFDFEKLGEYYMGLQEKDPSGLVVEVSKTEPDSDN